MKPPKHLKSSSKKLFCEICLNYQIDRAAEIILVAMLEARDRRDEARLAIRKSGATFVDRFGQLKPSPWTRIEFDAGTTMARCWRLLGFDQEPRGMGL